MGLSITKLLARLFSKKEMRILMVCFTLSFHGLSAVGVGVVDCEFCAGGA